MKPVDRIGDMAMTSLPYSAALSIQFVALTIIQLTAELPEFRHAVSGVNEGRSVFYSFYARTGPAEVAPCQRSAPLSQDGIPERGLLGARVV